MPSVLLMLVSELGMAIYGIVRKALASSNLNRHV